MTREPAKSKSHKPFLESAEKSIIFKEKESGIKWNTHPKEENSRFRKMASGMKYYLLALQVDALSTRWGVFWKMVLLIWFKCFMRFTYRGRVSVMYESVFVTLRTTVLILCFMYLLDVYQALLSAKHLESGIRNNQQLFINWCSIKFILAPQDDLASMIAWQLFNIRWLIATNHHTVHVSDHGPSGDHWVTPDARWSFQIKQFLFHWASIKTHWWLG